MQTNILERPGIKTGILLRYVFCATLLIFFNAGAIGQKKNVKKVPAEPVYMDANHKLAYTPDSLGNRIIDFSYCGYEASEKPIPEVQVKVVVPLKAGDATLRIQSALDYVAGLAADKNGNKGAVLLAKGVYSVSGSLHIRSSGVVLRGSGMGEGGTTLLAKGTTRATLLEIAGKEVKQHGKEIPITDDYVAVNTSQIHVENVHELKAGDDIIIQRPSTESWIDALGVRTFGGGLSALGWKPGQRDIFWNRKIVAINGNTLQLDAPLTTALDKKYGGGFVSKFDGSGQIKQIGVENLNMVSTYDHSNEKDESHRWMAITIDHMQDGWVRNIQFSHFAGSSVYILSGGRRITVQDCKSLEPISEIGGQRRNSFWTTGQQTLFQRIYSEQGIHDFAVGYCAAGPNAFVQCTAENSYGFSGAIDSWASGVLFDIIRNDGQGLMFGNRGQDGQGAGWCAANSLFWNCFAAKVDCYKPPTAENYAFGTWSQFGGDGYWAESNNWIEPRSFFYEQLKDRLDRDVSLQAGLQPMESEASSSPTVAVAAALTKQAYQPATTTNDWINTWTHEHPISVSSKGVKTIDELGVEQPLKVQRAAPMLIENGWLTRSMTVLNGKRADVPWWNGSVKPDYLAHAEPAITRYVPGRTGKGLTDNLDSVTNFMKDHHIVQMEQNYGLWYDRRRDDHERVHRMDGDVWPPFYELPFARSGQGIAFDGLSKYDLTKYNTWYWSRLKEFADLADEKGLVLIHHNYFQHNIIEAGAHYVDFPWRPVNNINHTGFPEPVHFAGDKRLFMAEQFYNENNPDRRKLHQAFIDQCLNNFSDNSSVIQFICEEYTGPLHFVQFWLDTILQWEKKNKKQEMIGLSTTKDVQDSVLADPVRAAVIKVIDIRYWYYQADGTAYAPLGGQSLAPRQQARQFKPKKTSFEQVYRAVREYRDKYPDKAILYSADSYDNFGWAVFMAGGSLPELPSGLSKEFLEDAATMRPIDLKNASKGQFALQSKSGDYIIYNTENQNIQLATMTSQKKYTLSWIDPSSGKIVNQPVEVNASGLNELISNNKKSNSAVVLWLKAMK